MQVFLTSSPFDSWKAGARFLLVWTPDRPVSLASLYIWWLQSSQCLTARGAALPTKHLWLLAPLRKAHAAVWLLRCPRPHVACGPALSGMPYVPGSHPATWLLSETGSGMATRQRSSQRGDISSQSHLSLLIPIPGLPSLTQDYTQLAERWRCGPGSWGEGAQMPKQFS